MNKTYPVLIGDIGGTNVRLSIQRISSNEKIPQEKIDQERFPSFDYNSLQSVIKKYLEKFKNTENYPIYGVVGVPGPIKDNVIMGLVNIPSWPNENGDELAKIFNIKKFVFLNDFTLNAYGVQTNLKVNEDYIIINDVPAKEGGAIGIIGPGSGLGMSFLIKTPESEFYSIGGSEGGHVDFFGKDKKSFELAEYAKKLFKQDLLAVERICSGQGLIPIYKFLCNYEKDIKRDEELGKKIDELNDLKKYNEVDKLNIELVTKGLENKCPLCKKVLEYFIEIFGEVAGNFSLNCLPVNGLYLVGGLSIALEPLIKSTNIFMEHYTNKDSFNYLLKTFPIYLVKNGNLGLLGAGEFARRLILKNEK